MDGQDYREGTSDQYTLCTCVGVTYANVLVCSVSSYLSNMNIKCVRVKEKEISSYMGGTIKNSVLHRDGGQKERNKAGL